MGGVKPEAASLAMSYDEQVFKGVWAEDPLDPRWRPTSRPQACRDLVSTPFKSPVHEEFHEYHERQRKSLFFLSVQFLAKSIQVLQT